MDATRRHTHTLRGTGKATTKVEEGSNTPEANPMILLKGGCEKVSIHMSKGPKLAFMASLARAALEVLLVKHLLVME